MAIIKNEVKEMDKITVNYLEMYLNHIEGYKQYKKEKANRVMVIKEIQETEVTAIQA
ncbi:hypothetical protein B0H99_10386 [Planomicrobium soli]|uniref:Uncharacterized protein n=1 Tax=Planomicrobium soli TaxID=1176648 RepID=A0A2P8H416_9BACL|nr:hypothetical protein [Planomicrobium soli]PSL40954.1 hypothetical protein B0H99_10386 [Planomicrobium soli]